jgi:hypothetical protein
MKKKSGRPPQRIVTTPVFPEILHPNSLPHKVFQGIHDGIPSKKMISLAIKLLETILKERIISSVKHTAATFWRVLEVIEEILAAVPEYHEFMTVEELNRSSQQLADEFTTVKLLSLGKSRQGREISALKLGQGKKNALLIGFPHPEEPVGSLANEFLSRFFAENPDILKKLGYTWYFIKVIDPDGVALNEGWFKTEFDLRHIMKHYYRPASHEQIEWTFPVQYKNLSFSSPPPETQALINLIDQVKPNLLVSMHNGFSGTYWYVSHEYPPMYPALIELSRKDNIPLYQGEPEAPFIIQLDTAIFLFEGIQKWYDFMLENGVEHPEHIIKCGTCSGDYLKRVTNGHGFTVICEPPYWYDHAQDDTSPSEYDRREVRVEALNFVKQVYVDAKQKFDAIRTHCSPTSKLFTVLEDRIDNYEQRLNPELHHAQTDPMYDGKATVGQAYESNVGTKLLSLTTPAMLSRLHAETALTHPHLAKDLTATQHEIEQWTEHTLNTILANTNITPTPIQSLVKLHVGTALIALHHHK